MNHDRPGLPSLFHGLTPSLLRLLANADVHEDNRSAGSNHATPRPCTPRQVSRRWRWWRSSPIARPSRATSSAARLSRMRRTVSARRSRTSTKPRASPVCRYRSVEDVDLPYATYGAVRLGRPARISSGPLPPGCRPRSRLRRRCVLEQTPVTAVESGGPCQVRTAGGTVTAQTGRRGHPLPAARPWLFFARLEPSRSYCIAARCRGTPPQGSRYRPAGPRARFAPTATCSSSGARGTRPARGKPVRSLRAPRAIRARALGDRQGLAPLVGSGPDEVGPLAGHRSLPPAFVEAVRGLGLQQVGPCVGDVRRPDHPRSDRGPAELMDRRL